MVDIDCCLGIDFWTLFSCEAFFILNVMDFSRLPDYQISQTVAQSKRFGLLFTKKIVNYRKKQSFSFYRVFSDFLRSGSL